MLTDEKYMQRCIELARLGIGYAAPNPMVGSVVVHEGKIIGEGYHERCGEAHAEVNAIGSVKDKSLLKSSTIYVNLEPCAHFGKTPPCADLIVASAIPKVVIGTIDPYAEVAGKGIKKLKAAGIDVTVNVLQKECLDLNRRFFTFHEKKRPYVILKWAQSADGFIDKLRTPGEKGIYWITAPETRTLVHKWRHEEAGIMVGRYTVKTDNPSLNCRDYDGVSPTRFVIDQKMRLDYAAFNVGDRNVQTYILTEKEITSSGQLQFVQPKSFASKDIMTKLYDLAIQSVIIEGGAYTLNSFLKSDIFDEIRILTGRTNLDKGTIAPTLPKNAVSKDQFKYGKDLINIYRHD